ncbi:MAG: hypothetical protein M1530_03700 [Candidatus Marsarchaeota archaeon]|nr:hypothetical protein [Candidatus Marsarchaeota archaeon]
MRLWLLAILLAVLAAPLPALNITSNSTSPCPAWTSWLPENISNVKITDMGYTRRCGNVTYVSFCVSGPTFINFSHARHYTDINCSDSDYCQGWTDFYAETSRNFTSRTPDNLTRTCTNTTFVSWCIKSSSVIDYRTARRYSQFSCGDWSQACAYQTVSQLKRAERSGAYCRPCNVTSYKYVCTFGGRPSSGQLRSQSTCGAWSPCSGVSDYLNASVSNSPSALAPAAPDSLTLLMAVAAGVGLTALLVLFFSRRKE